MSKSQRVARPRTREQIEEAAFIARAVCGLMPYDRVNVASLLEHEVPKVFEGFELRIAEPGDLGAAEAVTDSAKPIITFDDRIYTGLCNDLPRPRMTGLHELGHLWLHTGQTGMAFMRKPDPLVDIERQADIFAAAFMMPECAFRKVQSISEAMKTFGVSRDAATCRARSLQMFWLVQGKAKPRQAKKKGSSKRQTP